MPRVNDLLKVHAALLVLSSGNGNVPLAAGMLAEATGRLQDFEIPKELKLTEVDLELLKSSEVSRLAEINMEVQKEATKKKMDPKHLQNISDACWDLLAVPDSCGANGPDYAANFRSGDLLISDDPLFLRKHEFVSWGGSHDLSSSAELDISSDLGGTRVTGGFNRISTVAGMAATGSLRDVDATSSFVSAALIGSASRRRLVGLRPDRRFEVSPCKSMRLRIGWCWLPTRNPLYDAVGRVTYGLLSLNRRARLLVALRDRDWDSVWSSVSVDGPVLSRRTSAGTHETDAAATIPAMTSPATSEFRAAAGLPSGREPWVPTLQYLGRRTAPHMAELPPYEQIATEMFPAFLGERIAEFKIYLVRLFAREALPAAALPAVAEAASRAVLVDMQMRNIDRLAVGARRL